MAKQKKNSKSKWEVVGHVGVDSGQLMVCDPCYLRDQWQQDEDFGQKDDEKHAHDFSYRGCCIQTLSEEMYGQLNYKKGHPGAGVAFSSGYGDGTYEVAVRKNKEGRIVEARIKMG